MTPSAPSYVEEPAIYVFQRTMTALEVQRNLPVTMDNDSDFLLTGIHGTSTGTYTINLRMPSGRQIATASVQNVNLIGTANQPTAIGPAPVYRAASIGPALDISDTSNAGNTIEICFTGIRRLRI
jgi:hypothetical protein